MSVDIQVGTYLIEGTDRTYPAWLDAVKNAPVDAADPSNPRKDIVVAYVDVSVAAPGNTNSSGALKFKAVAGTPAGSPTDPSNGTITSTIGTSLWIKIARIDVAAGATSVVTANITDLRTPSIPELPYVYGGASNTNGHSVPNVPDDTLALLAAVQSLTNKTISGTTNKVRAGGSNSTLRDSNDQQIDLEAQRREHEFNYVASGCVWTGDSLGSTRNASMSAGVVYINGRRLTVSAVNARSFTGSKDTYVDFQDNGDGTAKVTYTEVTNNAASPSSLSDASTFAFATHLRNAIIVTGASSIASAGSINQGQSDKVLPIASSIAYTTTDSLGNLIYNTAPNPTVIGYRQITSGFATSSTSDTAVTGLSAPVIVPPGRKVKISSGGRWVTSSGSPAYSNHSIHDGTIGVTPLQFFRAVQAAANAATGFYLETPPQQPSLTSQSSKTYNAAMSVNGGTGTIAAGTDGPCWLKVELV
jgi:hypothetical protein